MASNGIKWHHMTSSPLTSHSGTDVILLLVGLDHIVHGALQHALNDLVGDHSLYHDGLAATKNPKEKKL